VKLCTLSGDNLERDRLGRIEYAAWASPFHGGHVGAPDYLPEPGG
jgi:hypothetical protein